jgi:hypothetical protein
MGSVHTGKVHTASICACRNLEPVLTGFIFLPDGNACEESTILSCPTMVSSEACSTDI